MRVAYVCTDPGIPVFGRKGASVHVQAVLQVLRARGAKVHLLAARVGGDLPPALDGVTVHQLAKVSASDAAQREREAQATDAAVGPLLDRLAEGGPLDLVYERYALWGRTATAWAAEHAVPSVLEVNAPLVEEQAVHRVLVDRAGADAVAGAALSAASAVVSVSDGVAQWARSRSNRPDRVVVVPNGVDVDRVTPAVRPVAAGGATPFCVGFVGTLKPWHGVDVLVDALARLHREEPGGYRLLLVGDGPQAGALREQASAAGVAGLIEWTGSVDPAQVPGLLHRMDLAVAPYPVADGCYFSPLKLYEYLAAGLPVVASAVGQVSAALDGGRLGVLVEPGSADALAAAVSALRADGARRTALRVLARQAAVERHSWERGVDRTLDALPLRAGTFG